jgi:DNA-binding NarL/FixJ family response regulator
MAWKMLQIQNSEVDKKQTDTIFSEREKDYFRLFSLGMTDDEIANRLVVSPVTVRTQINRIIHKLGVDNRVQAVLCGLRLGLASINDSRERLEEAI